MRRKIVFIMIWGFVFLACGCREKFDPLQSPNEPNILTPDNGAAIIKVVSPKEGDTFTTGHDLVVKWTAASTVKTLRIQLYREDQLIRPITLSTSNSGVWIWSIPEELVSSDRYRVKIMNEANSGNYSFSELFTIVQDIKVE